MALAFRSPLSIVLINKSTVVTDMAVLKCADALNVQLNRDFSPYWGIDGTVFAAKVQPVGALPCYILDNSDQANALGYHDNDPKLGPFGRVFAKTDQQLGLNWTVTASHEVLEMAADPFVFSTVQVNNTTFTALEVCDAVEADRDGYMTNGVWVSNFLTPAWFDVTLSRPFDFRNLLTRAFTLRRGGYMSVRVDGQGWTQRTAREIPGVTSRAWFAHRRIVKAIESDSVTTDEIDVEEQDDQ